MNPKQPLLPSTVPSYNVPIEDKHVDSVVHPKEVLRQMSWGIFQVAYSEPVHQLSLGGFRQRIRDLSYSAPSAGRLLLEIFRTARTPVAVHLLAAVLLIIAPAFSLYLSATILGIVEESVMTRRITEVHVNLLQVLVFMWLFVAITSTLSTRIMADTRLALSGHLRAHFLPQLVDASLRLDVASSQSRRAVRSLPEEYTFDTEVPGSKFFHEIVTRLLRFLTVVAEVGVLVMIISRREFHETRLLAFFAVMLPAVMLFKPQSGFGGAGFVFWTANPDYYYLAALYKLAFSQKYRPTLARDGMCAFIAQEYERVSRGLECLNVETLTIQCGVKVQWYWDLTHNLILDYPLVVCALLIPWSDPLSSLVTMVLVQHAVMTLRQSVELLRADRSSDTFVEVVGQAERLYEAIALDTEVHHGTDRYPDPTLSREEGMKISFRNVSFRYGEDGPGAVDSVSCDIQAGSLALVVGVNGSGKSSLLSLIPGIRQPSKGQVLIDDRPLADYDVASLRAAMACVSQDEDMYPLSLRANMLMGAEHNAAEVLERAAQMGCATRLIERFPSQWDTVLDPTPVSSQCIHNFGYGRISDLAWAELDAHGPKVGQTAVSGGEKQRLAATRMFARLLHLKERVRLIVCDEATGALDSRAERDILKQVKAMRVGRTVIVVTHRFRELVGEADVILVMKEGRLVQQGTHAELMLDERGEYAEMYNAQADSGL